MAVKKEFHTGALPSLEKATIVVVIHKGKKAINDIEYDLVEKIPFLSKKSFLIRQPSLEKRAWSAFQNQTKDKR